MTDVYKQLLTIGAEEGSLPGRLYLRPFTISVEDDDCRIEYFMGPSLPVSTVVEICNYVHEKILQDCALAAEDRRCRRQN